MLKQSATYRYELDAVQDPSLLSREGQLQAAQHLFLNLRKDATPLPEQVHLDVIVPDERWLRHIEEGLEKINHLAQPKGFGDKLKQTAFRVSTGVRGELYPIDYERDAQEPDRKMHLSMNLTGLSPDDVDKLAALLNKYASYKNA